MLQVEGLYKDFGSVQALQGVSLHLAPGVCYGLLGPNGAGKTTTINMLSGLLAPDRGTVRIAGLDPFGQPHAAKKAIGVVPQEIALYDELSARQNLRFWSSLYGLSAREGAERCAQTLERIGLSERADDPLRTFSGGMKRRVNIAAAILHQPRLLFMDEPTVGIDPQSRFHILELIEELHRDGMTILYTTHYMEEAQRLCDRIGILDHGKLIAEGSLDELREKVPGQRQIRVALRQLPPEGWEHLQQHYGERLSAHGNTLTLLPDQVQRDMATLIARCADAQLEVVHLAVSEPDLEGVFLELTGHALRD